MTGFNIEEAKDFIDAYKNSEQEKHFVKLFDKIGKEIIEPADDNAKWLSELKLHINVFFQEALKLSSISFLFGTGSSIPIGAEPIFILPPSIKEKIDKAALRETHEKLISCYPEKTVGLEKYLGDLIRLNSVYKLFGSSEKDKRVFEYPKDANPLHPTKIENLIKIIKKELFEICKVPNAGKISDPYYKNDPLKVHKEFIKKILARPVNLRRVNIYTTNYDLAFEKAMDDLGVIYIDGFVGNIKRMFKPEVYNYDFYFPASTTEGSVHRLDKVLHLYKLHGSLNWIESTMSSKNIFGIEQTYNDESYDDRLLIFPQPMKEEETLGFPYSEMFRRFSSIIQQPQNLLITYGYGFGDEHINRVIYNALSISTFQLIVVSYGWTDKLKGFYNKVKDDSRISFMIGSYLASWQNFVMESLPDIKKMELDEKIVKTMQRLKGESPDALSAGGVLNAE